MSEAMVYVRAVHFAATVAVVGAVFFMVLVAEPAFRAASGEARVRAIVRSRLAWIAWIGLALVVLSGAAWLVLVAGRMSDRPVDEVFAQGILWTVLLQTGFGRDWLARSALVCLLAAAFVCFLSKRRVESTWLNAAMVVIAAALAGTLAWAGHAAGGSGIEGIVHPAADVLHLIAAAAWVGALVPLALLLGAVERAGAPLAIARTATLRFSILGIASVGTLLTTGIINTWYEVGSVGNLIETAYGRLIVLKIGLFAAMIAIATVNRFHLTPRLAAAGNVRRLRRNSLAETVLGFAAVLVVGFLGTMAPAIHARHHHAAYAAVPAAAAFVHIHTEQGMADVTIMPGRTGAAHAAIRLWNEDFEPLAAQGVTLSLTAPAVGSKPTTRFAAQDSDGAWQVDGIELLRPGNWTVTIEAALGPAGHLSLEAPIVIEP